MTLLNVDHLHVRFSVKKKQLHAVRGISFSLNPGEVLGIVGESGCGKSATAKAILQLLPSHKTSLEGTIWYGEQNLLTSSEKEMRKVRGKEIAMIFQDPMTSLNPSMKIGHQIAEGYRLHHPHISHQEAWDYACQMLELVGIPEPRTRISDYPHTLSGGQRQRVMIALALACKPKLLIADEPTTALDVTIQAQILELLKELKQKTDTSIILITHDLSVVAGFCDRVIVMYAGRIVESASVDDLFAKPSHPYTQRLLASLPRLDIKQDFLVPIEGSPPNLLSPIKGCSFCPRCPHVMKRCEEEDPPFYQVGSHHHEACWRNHD